MSATQSDRFEKTLLTTALWLDEIAADIGTDRERAWDVLAAVLRILRERLPVGLGGDLGAMLPTLARGAYYDRYRPAAQLICERSADEFLKQVAAELASYRDVDAREATRAVFALLARHAAPERSDALREALPETLRNLWTDPRAPRAAPDLPPQTSCVAETAASTPPLEPPGLMPEPVSAKPAAAMPELSSLPVHPPPLAEAVAAPKRPPQEPNAQAEPAPPIKLEARRRFRTAASADY